MWRSRQERQPPVKASLSRRTHSVPAGRFSSSLCRAERRAQAPRPVQGRGIWTAHPAAANPNSGPQGISISLCEPITVRAGTDEPHPLYLHSLCERELRNYRRSDTKRRETLDASLRGPLRSADVVVDDRSSSGRRSRLDLRRVAAAGLAATRSGTSASGPNFGNPCVCLAFLTSPMTLAVLPRTLQRPDAGALTD